MSVTSAEPVRLAEPRRMWAWMLLIAVVACAVYAQTARYAFAYDDVGVIQERALFHSIANWRSILTASWWPNKNLYRPLTVLTFAANWTASAGAPGAFHVTNIVLHGLASVLVLLLVKRLAGAGAGIAAGLLFAVHPVHVEAVANVVGRAELLATILGVAAVLAYMWDGALADAGDTGSWRRYLASFGTLLATALALAAKESAFALPALALLADWFDHATKGKKGLGVDRHWVLWLGTVAMTVAWLLWRARMVGDLTGLEVAPGLEGAGLVERTVIMLPIVGDYVRLLFAPVRLSVDYNPDFIRPESSLTWGGVGGILLLLGGLAAAWIARHRAPAVTFALGWLAATILIVANILVPTGVLLAERTLYLPSIGAVLLLALAWRWCADRWRGAAWGGLALVVAAGALRTTLRNPIWRDNDILLPQLVRDAPGSYHGKWVEAMLAERRGDIRGAEKRLREALSIHPLAWSAWRDLGRVLDTEGRFSEASDCWWAAWQLNNNAVLTAQRSIQTALMAGRTDTAAARLAVAQAARPQSGELILAAADVALQRGEARRAMTLRRQVAWQYPDSARFWGLTAEAALKGRDCQELVRSLGRLHALRADSAHVALLAAGAQGLGCR